MYLSRLSKFKFTRAASSGGSRIFPGGGGAPTPKSAIIFQFFAENCMKMKEFGPPPLAPPLGSANGQILQLQLHLTKRLARE